MHTRIFVYCVYVRLMEDKDDAGDKTRLQQVLENTVQIQVSVRRFFFSILDASLDHVHTFNGLCSCDLCHVRIHARAFCKSFGS